MSIPLVQVDVQVSDGPLVSQRVEAQAKRAGFRAMGEYHNRNILGRHTARGAATRYSYHRRGTKYVKLSKRKFPQWRPMYRTGTLARTLREEQKVTATQFGGRLAVRATLGGGERGYVTALSGRPRIKKRQISLSASQEAMIQRAEEIKAMVPEEYDQLAEQWHRGYARGIATRRMVRVTKR